MKRKLQVAEQVREATEPSRSEPAIRLGRVSKADLYRGSVGNLVEPYAWLLQVKEDCNGQDEEALRPRSRLPNLEAWVYRSSSLSSFVQHAPCRLCSHALGVVWSRTPNHQEGRR